MQTETDRATRFRLLRSAGLALCAALCAPARAQVPQVQQRSCNADWSAEFGRLSSADSTVYALAAFDDGSTPAIYAAGSFSRITDLAANRIARWDGSSWSALGSGIGGGLVAALAVFDDPSGPALFAGGNFSSAGAVPASGIAR